MIQQAGPDSFCEGAEVAMLVNNLGSTPVMEVYIMVNAALAYAQDKLKVSLALYLWPYHVKLARNNGL